MDDRRQHSRHTTQLNIEAFDLHSGRRLGRIVDLSEEGFMLISEVPPEADSVWECRLVLDQPLDGIHEVRVGADCLWSRPGESGGCSRVAVRLASLASAQFPALRAW